MIPAIACITLAVAAVYLQFTVAPAIELVRVGLAAVFVVGSLGNLVVQAMLPELTWSATRTALVVVVGYAAAPILAITLSRLHAPFLFVPLCVLAAAVSAWMGWRAPRGELVETTRAQSGAWWLVVVASLSVIAISPLMQPLRRNAAGGYVSYAYIDAYKDVLFVQGLVRHIPLADWPSLAGMRPGLFPDFPYTFLAMLARMTGVAGSTMYFAHGAMLLVVMTVLLFYALGRELTGTTTGAVVAAVLPVLFAVPNPYDMNPALNKVDLGVYLPTFYQIHFYTPRYNGHNGAGYLVLIGVALALLLWRRHQHSPFGSRALVLAGLLLATLARERPQHVLAAGLAFGLLISAVAVKERQWRAMFGVAALAVGIGVLGVDILLGPYSLFAARLTVTYGDYARYLLDEWYLPARLQPVLGALPSLIRPAVTILVWTSFRIVGFWLGAFVLFRAYQWIRHRQVPDVAEVFLGLVGVCAVPVAILIRHSVNIGNIGGQVLTLGHFAAQTLAIVPAAAVVAYIAGKIRSTAVRTTLAAVALLVLTGVANRAATAALYDQQTRAYPISDADLRAYQWIDVNAPAEAIVAAHPDHVVNPIGETIKQTDLLPAMTARRAYLARAWTANKTEGNRRAAQLRALFAAATPAAACAVAIELPVDYLVEYADFRVTTSSAPCLGKVFAGDVNVYRVERPILTARQGHP